MFSRKLYLFLTFLFFVQFAQGQLSNFTLNVTPTNETCTSNGTLTFTVSNTTAGSVILYSVYLLPNVTTPISVQSTTTISGLAAGNYRIIATQSLGSDSGTQQQDANIESALHPLTYQISSSDELCGNDGTMTINVITGNFLNCEIFAGPMTRPLQTSTTFNGLVAGQYSIRVFNACNDGVVQTFTIIHKTPGLIITTVYSNAPSNCTTANVHQILSHSSSTVIAYPLAVQYSVHPPSGGTPIIFNQTVLYSPFYDPQSINQDIPLFPNQNYNYDVRVTDACGNIYSSNGNIVNSSTMPVTYQFNGNCNSLSMSIYYALSATIISAPPSYPNLIPHNLLNAPQNNLVFIANDLTPGFYSFNVIDVCGVAHVLNYMIGNQPDPIPPSIRVGGGCQIGFRTVTISSIFDFSTVIIVSAPGSFQQTIPYNFSFGITPQSSGYFVSGDLPEGDYVFRVVTECGYAYDLPIYVDGYYMSNTIDVIENCGSFDISLFHTSNNLNAVPSFWLQKYNPALNQWGHPITGINYPTNSLPNTLNSITLNNNTVNFNFTASGHFRIIRSAYEYQAGTTDGIECINVLQEFDYYAQPRINRVYTFACANNKYDAIVDGVGIGNLIYRITTKNGNSFLIENANNPVFLDLDPATYNFQVEDSCGNIFNITLDLPTPFDLEITPSNLCDGQTTILTVPFFPFLNYQWWKDDNVATILGTTNILSIPSYNSTTDSGVYHVRITYANNPSSCINSVIDFDTSSFSIVPHAGVGSAISYCGNQGSIDLFTLLTGSYDTNGVWTETTNSGTLNNSIWDSESSPIGLYQFKYRVTGTCNLFDESTINIRIRAIPQTPIASSDTVVCNTGDLNLYATNILNTTYNWTGPNGFTSNEQNPTITPADLSDSGTYSVHVVDQFNCVSQPSSIDITVFSNPVFIIDGECNENRYVLTATPIQNSYDSDNVTYNWTGPNNFSSSTAICDLTGQQTGEYTLVITNTVGCTGTNSYNATLTLCSIPQGVSANNDGDNDTFNLSGFGGVELKIFNRYGMVVYEINNYLNEWKGQDYTGNMLPTSTYYYLIKLPTGETKTGWVYLLY